MSAFPRSGSFVTDDEHLVKNQVIAHLSSLRCTAAKTSHLGDEEYKTAQAAAIEVRHLCGDDHASRELKREAICLMRGLVERRRIAVGIERLANRELKSRIIKAISAAAGADPNRFEDHVEGCRALWRQTGLADGDNRQLGEAYKTAVTAFNKALRSKGR